MGCSTGGAPALEPAPGAGGEFVEEYPAGPYGTEVGSVVQSYDFECYLSKAQQATGELAPFQLADLYNPSGEGIYADDSLLGAGQPKKTLLVINVSASWCAPCKHEASELLPEEYEHFRPLGVEFLVDLADGDVVGEAAGIGNLDAWVSSFDVEYLACIDPEYKLGALFDQALFPANLIIDLRTMTVEELAIGVPQDSFWLRVEELLGD